MTARNGIVEHDGVLSECRGGLCQAD
jgi:hypothetical protein